ncbi:MAG: glycosyltransferase family 29 protein [Dehalococcoidia bacterium]
MVPPDRRNNDAALRDYLAGKRVVIVGPAATISGRGMGEFIDGHDVVVRVNLGSPVPGHLRGDIGSRTDVLYHILFSRDHEMAIGRAHTADEVAAWREDGVRFLVVKHPRHSERVQRIVPLLGDLPLVHIPHGLRERLRYDTQAAPNTGTYAIAHLLSMPVASLHVTGFDFYASGYYAGYGGFSAAEAARGGGQGVAYPSWGQTGHHREIHRQEGQKEYLRRLAETEPRLTFDEVAASRLGLVAPGIGVTAIVPMKGRSERVPNKNVRLIAGRPLLYWTIAALHEARRVERIVVDTDSDEIERLVVKYFPDVRVLRRPEHLQDGDRVTANDLLAWELEQIEGEHFGQFHATSPLISPLTIDLAVAAYFSGQDEGGAGEYDSLFTVTEHHFWLFRADGTPVNSDTRRLIRSQDLDPLYEDNSAAHLFSRRSFAATGSRIGERPRMYPIPKVEAIDIDYEDDFAIADAVLTAREAAKGPRNPYARQPRMGRRA